MSSVRDDPPSSAEPIEDVPEFELEYLYDDPVDPSELTIFAPTEDRLATEWITVDRSAAVPIEVVR